MKSAKRLAQLMESEDSDKPLNTLLAKQFLQPRPQHMICGYSLKLRHLQRNCREAYELRFVCGSGDQLKSDSPLKKAENTTNPINSSSTTVGRESRTY